ncbi:MAG: hypothetical protein ACK5VP_01890 [Betaproteobacteria bacterium]
MSRDTCAKRVFFASAAPPVRFPNVYGIDMPSARELIANGRGDGAIAREIGADCLIYQDLDGLVSAVRSVNPRVTNFETSCFSGLYVTGDVTADYLAGIEAQRNDDALARRASTSATTQLDLNLMETAAG